MTFSREMNLKMGDEPQIFKNLVLFDEIELRSRKSNSFGYKNYVLELELN